MDMCGPRSVVTDLMSDAEWRNDFTFHRGFKDTMLQDYAGRFEQLSVDQGGEGNMGNTAHRLSTLWFERDIGMGQDQAAAFFRAVCREMRSQTREEGEDGGPLHSEFQPGSMKQLTMGFVYEACKHGVGVETCKVGFAQTAVDFSYEVSTCLKSQPACLRNRELCLGSCDGAGSGGLTQDFATTYVKQELSVKTIGSDGILSGRANCSFQNRTIKVPLFSDSDSFRLYSARIKVRGGFNAIDPRACRREPQACAAIQRVLEKEPTLTYDTNTGRFRHAYALTPPLPPPPPKPPPRIIQYNLKFPPPPAPPPAPPPPWYDRIERCVPTITAAEAGIDTSLTQTDEERALCLYVRALMDERIPASRCFAQLSPFPPPPPPLPQSALAAIQTAIRRAKLRRGGSGGPEDAPPLNEEEEYVQQHVEQSREVNSLLDRLSAENWQLRDALKDIRAKFNEPSAGRRLFERLAGTGNHNLEQNIKASELSVGNGALMGLTIAQCSTLCTALKNDTDSLHSCNGIMYRMLEPDNAANLQTAYCYLLRSTGACEPLDFAASIFSRRDTSGCREPTAQDNPACVQVAPDRADMRILDFAAAKASCRQGKGHPLPPRMPRPRSSLEAFSMVGYARERGVHSFWAEKPIRHAERQLTHWSGLDGKPFYYPGNNDRRCILVATESENIHGFMYARMEPCDARLADGVVCESGSAAPPPPAGGGVSMNPPPNPPPPPIGVVASMRDFIKKEIRPRTEVICLAGLLDSDLSKLCLEFATALSKSTRAGTMGAFMPLCEDMCYHSCSAASRTDVDSFETCRGPECADTHCGSFLVRECPAHTHEVIRRTRDAACTYAAPSPPAPPTPPPRPPRIPDSPGPPPPPVAESGTLRLASSERPEHLDCLPVSYSACKRAAEEMHAINPRISPDLDLSQAACEGAEMETSSCFIGCALGNELGVPALLTFRRESVASEFSQFNSYRCIENSIAPYCLCATPPPPPPPDRYDAGSILNTDYAYAGNPESGTLEAQPSGFFKPIAVDSRLPDDFRKSFHEITCRGSDSGASQCTRACARDLMGNLRAFSITATSLPPSPPPPGEPPAPPSHPPSPLPPLSEYKFNGATDGCRKNGIYSGKECRDGALRPPTPRWLARSQPPLCLRRWRRLGVATRLRFWFSGRAII